jgi:hypothetical protein
MAIYALAFDSGHAITGPSNYTAISGSSCFPPSTNHGLKDAEVSLHQHRLNSHCSYENADIFQMAEKDTHPKAPLVFPGLETVKTRSSP